MTPPSDPPPDPSPAPIRPPSAWLRQAPLAAAGGVAVSAVVLLMPSFASWHVEDDLRTMRWVLEYRGEPWAALVELHSLHDHVRPATLIATWAGAMLSDGAWWGPHLVLVLLQLAGLAGLGVLAARLAENPWAGVGAPALALTLPGYEAMAGWNAWICTAGEVAFGLWGLVALHGALSRGRWPVLAPLLLVVAGMFKEPGWVVYPLAGAGLTGLAWSAGRRGARVLAGLAPVLLGLAGLAITWHPANVYRTAEGPTPWAERALAGILEQGRGFLDLWPLATPEDQPFWSGLSLPLIALAIWGAFRLPRAAAAGLLLLATGLGVMLPFESINAVQVLSAGYGLCLLVGVAAARGKRLPALLLGFLAVGVAHEAVELGVRLSRPDPRDTWLANRDRGDRFLGVAACTRALSADEAVLDGPLGDLVLAPLFGLRLREDRDLPGATLTLDGRLRLVTDERELSRVLLAPDLLAGRSVPLVRPRSENRRRPGGRTRSAGDRDDDVGLPLEDAAPGFYALGVALSAAPPVAVDLRIEARDGCGRRFAVSSPETRWTVTPVRIRDGCEPLRISWSGSGRGQVDRVFVSPMPPPLVSLRGAQIEERRLATPEQRGVPPIFEPSVR